MNATPPAPAAAAPTTPPLLRPTAVDYFLIVTGFALSFYLARLSGYQAAGAESIVEPNPAEFRHVLPTLVFLTLGPLLLWPVFYGTQRLVGRPQALAPGEWLWGVA